MTKKTFLTLIIFTVVIIFDLSTTEVKIHKLSLLDVINLSIKNNLDIKKEDMNLKDKMITLYSAINKFYPELSLSSSINSGYDYDKNVIDNSIKAGFSMSLSLSAKTIFDIRESLLDFDMGKITYEKTRALLLKNLKLSYFNIVLLKDEIKIKEQALKNAENRYKKALIQFKDGEISQLDILNEEYSYKSIIPDLINMKNNCETVRNLCNIIIGIAM